MQCQNKQKNLENCNCTYGPCDKKGTCCECMRFHLKNNELPACFFPDDADKTFDRSFGKFAQINK